MSDFLIDSNVLIDIATADPKWMAWSESQILNAVEKGLVYINPIIYAELCPTFSSAGDLDHWLDPAIFQRATLPYEAGWLAAQAFLKYRRGGVFETRHCRISTSARMPRLRN